MPRRDVYHDVVRRALIADGWTITHDPLILSYGGRDLFVDLGADAPLGAEREGRKIAVEIKSFVSPSDMHDLEVALGQYALYRTLLGRTEADRVLYLAVPNRVYLSLFSEPLGQLVIQEQRLHLLVFDDEKAKVEKWIP